MPEILVKLDILFVQKQAMVAKHYEKHQESTAMTIRQIIIILT